MVKRRGGMSYARNDFVPGAPRTKIVKFTMGNTKDDFECTISLVAKDQVQVRGVALESARVTANKILEKELSVNNYRLQIRVYPHEIIREHKQMGFAGADRVSQGMRKAFGKPRGRAAQLARGQAVLSVYVNKDGGDIAKKALKRASKKLPLSWRIVS